MIQRNALLSKMCHLEKKPQKLLKKKRKKNLFCGSIRSFVCAYQKYCPLIRHTMLLDQWLYYANIHANIISDP